MNEGSQQQPQERPPKESRGCYVGMPAYLHLQRFAEVVREAFPGGGVYLVGSTLYHEHWRDVDVRLMLPDDAFATIIGPLTSPRYVNPRWNAMCLAFSALGRHMTGLLIDFQIDQQTAANVEFKGKRRSAIAAGNGPRCIGQIDHATGEPVADWWEALG
jgi:hypothetical protein